MAKVADSNSSTIPSQGCCSCFMESCSECCIPSVLCTVCCFVPSFHRHNRQQAETWLVKHPSGTGCCRTCCYFCDLTYDCNPGNASAMLLTRKQMYGEHSFCSFNKVCVTNPEESEPLLLTDQGRGPFLGLTNLLGSRLPVDETGRKVFILELSGLDKKTDGLSDHDAFRNALLTLTTSPECLARVHVQNPVMKKILTKLELDVQKCQTADDICRVAIPSYLLRSLHWGILALDLSDMEFSFLFDVYYGGMSAFAPHSVLWHLWGSGSCLSGGAQKRAYSVTASLYERSPIITAWKIEQQFHSLTKDALVHIIMRTFTIAALQGPLNAMTNIIKNNGGHIPKEFDMPISNREKMRLVILEHMRIKPPVLSSTVVPDKPFKCPFGKAGAGAKDQWFPAKTPVAVSLFLHGRNEQVWNDATSFRPYDRDLWGPTSRCVVFNGVGDKGPRLCPGRDVALELLISGLQVVFNVTGDPNKREVVVDNTNGLVLSTVANQVIDATVLMTQILHMVDKDVVLDPMEAHIDQSTRAWILLTASKIDRSIPVIESKAIKKLDDIQLLVVDTIVLSESPLLHVKIAESDEDFEDSNLLQFLSSSVLESIRTLKRRKELVFFPNIEAAARARDIRFSKYLPTSEIVWDPVAIATSAGLTKLVFSGLAQQYLTAVRSDKATHLPPGSRPVFEVDISFLANYNVRERYEKYGVIAFFAEDRTPLGIWWDHGGRMVTPLEIAAWKHAMCTFRSSLITAITFKEHLAHVHLVISNGLQMACRETLSASHPIRRLLKPHCYRTAAMNRAAKQALIPVNGLAYRVFGLNADSFPVALKDCIAAFKYETFPDFIASKGLSAAALAELPLAVDGLDLWNTIRKFVRAYVLIFYPDDAAVQGDSELPDFWGHFSTRQLGDKDYGLPPLAVESLVDYATHAIFSVTGGHELFGAVVEYLQYPSICPPKVCIGKDEADVQSFYLSLALISLTGNRQPMLINDWTHLHEYLRESAEEAKRAQYDRVVASLGAFNEDLRALSRTVDDRNKARLEGPPRQSFMSYNPRIIECSVSV